MIAIDVAKLRLSMKELGRRKNQVMKAGVDGYRQKVYYLLEIAAKVSPQFTGDFASNWNVVVNGDMPVYKPWADKVGGSVSPRMKDNGQVEYAAHRAGDPQAVATSKSRGASQSKKITSMKDVVHLVNATDLDMTGRQMVGPDGAVDLRAVNLITNGQRIESYLRARARERIPIYTELK